MSQGVAVVGAGLAGAWFAALVQPAGRPVVLFDKGRGPGGRLSGRRHGAARFQHGAPQLDLDPAEHGLEAEVARWEQRGWIRAEEGSWRSRPGNALVKGLLEGLDARFGTRVTRVSRGRDGWALYADEQELAVVETLVIAVPAPQAAELLPDHPFGRALQGVETEPRWVVMVETTSWSGRTLSPAVQRVVGHGTLWALHAATDWSITHLEDTPSEACSALLGSVPELEGHEVHYAAAHRWRYAQVVRPLEAPFLWDRERGLVVVGDAFGRGAGAALGSAKQAAHAWREAVR